MSSNGGTASRQISFGFWLDGFVLSYFLSILRLT